MAHTALEESGTAGRFLRTASGFREMISEEHSVYKPESGRYHLYISYACPWANRCLVVRNMKGLQDAIGLSIVHPTWQRSRPEVENDTHAGWVFANPEDPPLTSQLGYGMFPPDGCIPDTVNGAKFIRDLYEMSDDIHHKYSVPVLWDKKTRTIVNNESSEIIRMFNSAFNAFATNPSLDLYPEHLRSTIDAVNEWVYDHINNGVYKCGFAKTQVAYDEAIVGLYAHLDRAEELLSTQRYLAGSELTEADIRLFMTLVRFDEVYVVYFKCNKKRIVDFPNLAEYCKEMYQLPQMAEAINMYHIKTHYYTSHSTLNYYAIVPAGPNVLEELMKPHNRHQLSA